MNITGRKVQRFRCTIDPMIPPRPRNSFDRRELTNWEFELTPAGVYVKCVLQAPGKTEPYIEEHVVPWTNIQSIKLFPVEEKKVPAGDEKTDEKKKE